MVVFGSMFVLCFVRMILRLRALEWLRNAHGRFLNMNRADDTCFVHVFGINGYGAGFSDMESVVQTF